MQIPIASRPTADATTPMAETPPRTASIVSKAADALARPVRCNGDAPDHKSYQQHKRDCDAAIGALFEEAEEALLGVLPRGDARDALVAPMRATFERLRRGAGEAVEALSEALVASLRAQMKVEKAAVEQKLEVARRATFSQ